MPVLSNLGKSRSQKNIFVFTIAIMEFDSHISLNTNSNVHLVIIKQVTKTKKIYDEDN